MTGDDPRSEASDLLPRVIADAAAVAAGLPLGPAGPFVSAVAAPYLEAVAQWAWDMFGEDSKNRILRMLAQAWHVTGLSSTRFASRIGRSEQTRLLTATAIRGASSTAWPPKVTAIGDLLAKGLIADDNTEIDLVALGLAAMADMERPHVSLLDLLVNYTPDFTVAGSQAVPHVRTQNIADASWQAGARKWTTDQITTIRPKLGPALQGLMGTLVRHGLAIENGEAAEAVEDALRGFKQRGRQQAARMRAGSRITAELLRPHIPQVPRIVRSWSPTELGEQLLDLYREAAGDDKHGDAESPGPQGSEAERQ